MYGEPQPDAGDRLDRHILGLKKVWFGAFAIVVVIACTLIAIIMSGGGPGMDLDDKVYLWPLVVLMGFAGAYVLPFRVGIKEPAGAVRGAFRGSYPGWEGTKPDDTYYWLPLYAHRSAMRVGSLSGGAMFCAVGFFLTGNWLILIGTCISVAALVVEVPTRSAVESFAAARQQRQQSDG